MGNPQIYRDRGVFRGRTAFVSEENLKIYRVNAYTALVSEGNPQIYRDRGVFRGGAALVIVGNAKIYRVRGVL